MLNRTFGCVRLVWNRTLADRHRTYQTDGIRTSYKETDAALTAWKKTSELSFLSEVSSVPLQQTLRHQHTAYQNFFAKRARYPRFKRRTDRQSAHYTRSAFRMRGGELWLAKTSAPLRFVWSWPDIDPATLNPTMVIVCREPDGRWYVTFSVDAPDLAPLPDTGRAVGVDLGVKDFATTSDGDKVTNHRHLERKARNLARYQRRMARKQRGSTNRTKAKLKVARANRKVRNARRDFLHRVSTDLVRRYDTIAIEDLNIAGMSSSARGNAGKHGRKVRQKARLNKAILDASLGEFRSMLEYKAERAGRTLVVVDRWFPSSKTCSTCGHLLEALSMSTRSWTCPGCGARHDRDVNAAKNIIAAGLAVARENSGDACGAGVSLQGSSLQRSATKQELSGASPMGIPRL